MLFFLIFVPFLLNAAGVKHKDNLIKKKHYAAGEILTFTIPGQIGPTVIDNTGNYIGIVVHAGTDVTALTPTITVTPGYTVNPTSGTTQNFSSAVAYIVSDVNGVQTAYYSVNVLPTRVVTAKCAPAST